MPHRTTHTNHRKLFNQPFTWIRSNLLALPQRLFVPGDTAARRHGWHVDFIHGGFGRKYRDPRFDTLSPCGDCQGYGVMLRGNSCQRCSGSGRIVIKPITKGASMTTRRRPGRARRRDLLTELQRSLVILGP
jgi:hypothetical protein